MNTNRPLHDFGLCAPMCDHREPDAEQVEICRAWLRKHARPRQSLNRDRTSYGLKHQVERDSEAPGVSHMTTDRDGRCHESPRVYVSNGAFIAAAIAEGYSIRETGLGSPNVHLNIGVSR